MLNTKQIKTLQSKDWSVKDKGFSIDATEITVLGFGVISK